MKNWRSTVQSILTGVIALAGLSATPEFSWLPPKYAGAIASLGIIAKIVLGVLQKDVEATNAVPASSAPTGAVKPIAVIAVAALLLGCLPLTACNDFERNTYQTLAASKAVIDQAQADYESGKIAKTQIAHDAIQKAKDAQSAAVLSFQEYEAYKVSVKSGGDIPARQQAVETALVNLGPLIAAVKQLYSGVK